MSKMSVGISTIATLYIMELCYLWFFVPAQDQQAILERGWFAQLFIVTSLAVVLVNLVLGLYGFFGKNYENNPSKLDYVLYSIGVTPIVLIIVVGGGYLILKVGFGVWA